MAGDDVHSFHEPLASDLECKETGVDEAGKRQMSSCLSGSDIMSRPPESTMPHRQITHPRCSDHCFLVLAGRLHRHLLLGRRHRSRRIPTTAAPHLRGAPPAASVATLRPEQVAACGTVMPSELASHQFDIHDLLVRTR